MASKLAAKLRALYEEEGEEDDLDALDSSFALTTAPKKTKKRGRSEEEQDAFDGGASGEKRLRLRADIPMLVSGKKVSRKQLEAEPEQGSKNSEAGSESEDADEDGSESGADDRTAEDLRSEGSSLGDMEGEEDDAIDEDDGIDNDEDGSDDSDEDGSDIDDDSDEDGSDVAPPHETVTESTPPKATSLDLGIDETLDAEYEKLLNDEEEQQVPLKHAANKTTVIKKATVERQLEAIKHFSSLRIHLEPCLKAIASQQQNDEDDSKRDDEERTKTEILKLASQALTGLIKLQSLTQSAGTRHALESAVTSNTTDPQQFLASTAVSITNYCAAVAERARQKTSTATKTQFRVLDQSIPSQIEKAVQDESWKTKAVIPSHSSNSSVYTDKDFYATWVKDFLQHTDRYGSSNVGGSSGEIGRKSAKKSTAQDLLQTDADMGEELAALNLKRQKSKKNELYDRRASKGRKIRYQPIEKLQNFVAAREDRYADCDEDMLDQLVSSLFRY